MHDKNTFFKAIDTGNHLNNKTREEYWHLFTEKCDQNLQTLYKVENSPFTDTGIHLYIKFSLDKFFSTGEKDKGAAMNQAGKAGTPAGSKLSPIDKDWKKDTATTWGTNDDVKGK